MFEIKNSAPELFSKWKTMNAIDDAIREELTQQGMGEDQIAEKLQAYKKYRNDERQRIGFMLTGIGSFVGFLSCLFTMLDLSENMRVFNLYGLSSIALVLIFFGLYMIFE